jgi:hypothetical protein
MEQIPDPESRETARRLMEAILELHGAGLERMMEIVYEFAEGGEAAIRRVAADPLVSSLLVLHDLHPDELETRVHHALGKLNGSAELLGLFEGVVRVRLTGCASKETVEAAIRDAVPDAAGVIVEPALAANGFVPLTALGASLANAQ